VQRIAQLAENVLLELHDNALLRVRDYPARRHELAVRAHAPWLLVLIEQCQLGKTRPPDQVAGRQHLLSTLVEHLQAMAIAFRNARFAVAGAGAVDRLVCGSGHRVRIQVGVQDEIIAGSVRKESAGSRT